MAWQALLRLRKGALSIFTPRSKAPVLAVLAAAWFGAGRVRSLDATIITQPIRGGRWNRKNVGRAGSFRRPRTMRNGDHDLPVYGSGHRWFRLFGVALYQGPTSRCRQ